MNIDTKTLQKELLEIMKSFHDICCANDIKYYMLGGSCLGAIRHKGFIPWDDDMDVGLPRKDYDKFCKEAKNILPSNLELRYYKSDKNSPFHYVKLINKNTTLVEKNYINYVEGLYIDVFPLDGMNKFNFLGKMRAQIIWLCKAILIYHLTTTVKKKIYQNVFKIFARCISLKFIHIFVEKLMTLNKMDNPPLLCNFFGSWEPREIIPSSVFGQPTLYQFENTAFYGPQKADVYLKSLYDDYMQLPPEKDRICRHDYHYVNLNLPYRGYKKENAEREV